MNVVDGGKPFPRTGDTTVTINVEDVNDKRPRFEKETNTMYVSESLPVGEPVLTLLAEDVDRNALLEFDIVEPISARDKTGNSLMNRVGRETRQLILKTFTFSFQTLLILSSICFISKVLRLASIWSYLQGSALSIFWANIDTKKRCKDCF